MKQIGSVAETRNCDVKCDKLQSCWPGRHTLMVNSPLVATGDGVARPGYSVCCRGNFVFIGCHCTETLIQRTSSSSSSSWLLGSGVLTRSDLPFRRTELSVCSVVARRSSWKGLELCVRVTTPAVRTTIFRSRDFRLSRGRSPACCPDSRVNPHAIPDL
jgi:hypothetical protein